MLIPLNYTPRPYQVPIWNCDRRFQIIKAHRRFGKTKLAFNRLVKQVLIACAKRRPQESLISAYYFFPTLRLAREVVWDNLRKLHIPQEWPQNTNNMVIELPGSGMIYVSGCDDTVKRGFNPSFVVFDEWAEVRDSGIWPEVVRPVLAENGGSATFIYTPKGRNHAWELSKKTAGRPDWEHFTLPVSATQAIPSEELALAKLDMPESLYRQEFECEEIDNATGVFRFNRSSVVGGFSKEGNVQLGVDLAKSADWTVITPFNTDTFEVGEQVRFNQIDWNLQKARIQAEFYKNKAQKCVIDQTGVGSPIVDDLRLAGMNVEGFVFTERSREELLLHLALLLEQGKITLPDDDGLLQELDAFSYVMNAGGRLTMQSPMTDDRVMSLALAVWGWNEKRRKAVLPMQIRRNMITGEIF